MQYSDIILDDNDSSTINQQVYPRYGTPEIYNGRVSSQLAVINVPIKQGFAFDGWFTELSGGVKVIDADGIPVANVEDLTDENGNWILVGGQPRFYAQWTAEEYDVTLDLNGGSLPEGSSNPMKVTYGEKYEGLPTPTRAGWEFLGWYLDSACTIKYEKIEKGTTGNLVLYAKWDVE